MRSPDKTCRSRVLDAQGAKFGVCHESALARATTESAPFYLPDLDSIHFCKRIQPGQDVSPVGA